MVRTTFFLRKVCVARTAQVSGFKRLHPEQTPGTRILAELCNLTASWQLLARDALPKVWQRVRWRMAILAMLYAAGCMQVITMSNISNPSCCDALSDSEFGWRQLGLIWRIWNSSDNCRLHQELA